MMSQKYMIGQIQCTGGVAVFVDLSSREYGRQV